MQDTAGTWLMTALTTSPLLIALMQTAASLPVLFLGLPAGATADIFDRRRLLIFWQAWMLATVALLSVLTMLGVISPAVLLVLTFLLNIGTALEQLIDGRRSRRQHGRPSSPNWCHARSCRTPSRSTARLSIWRAP